MADNEPIRVLIVEAQQVVRLGLQSLLAQLHGMKVVGEAVDGKAAVEQALALRPDVILMNLALAEVDGIDATRQIKSVWPEARILILTADESDDYVFASMAAGADGYCLIKNVSDEQLTMAIHAVTQGATWLDRGIAKQVLRQNAAFATQMYRRRKEDAAFDLSEREMEVLQLLVEGLSNQQMADRLVISVETIKTHMRHIMEKLAVSDRTQAAVKAVRNRLI